MNDLISLGAGHTAELVWAEGVDHSTGLPVGLVERHHTAIGTCSLYIGWAISNPGITDPNDLWTLVSLRPLSVEPSLACPTCGLVGRIDDGRFEPRRITSPGSAT